MAYTTGLRARGVHVEVAALSPGAKRSEEAYMGTELTRLSTSLSQLPATLAALASRLKRTSFDSIFMISGGSTFLGVLILGLAKFARVKSCVFFYGRDILQARGLPGGRLVLALSVLLAHGVATNSRFTASLVPLAQTRPLTIIYPGVGADISDGFKLERDPRSPRILFVGRLVRRKGADLLLSAFSTLRTEFPGLRLDIVGDGPELGSLRNLVRSLDLTEFVTFWGALRGQALWEKYAQASLFVMPSRESRDDVEGFGTVFLEAGAFRIPSVGTRTGGIPEAVIDGTSGKLVESDDVAGLAAAIGDLLTDRAELERLGRNAQQRALQLTWGVSTDKVLSLLSA